MKRRTLHNLRNICPAAFCSPLWLAMTLLAGCPQEMGDQPRAETYESSDFFVDGMSARPQVPGTVARGDPVQPGVLETGMIAGNLAPEMPMEIDRAMLDRGRERYTIFCSPCHDAVGTGRGIVVQRGFRKPASFHIPRLREARPGHYFDVMTNGFGTMPAYRSRISPTDRWAILAFIRALQLSQYADWARLPPDVRHELGGPPS